MKLTKVYRCVINETPSFFPPLYWNVLSFPRSKSSSSEGQRPVVSAVCRRLQHHRDESAGGSADPQHFHTLTWRDPEGIETLEPPGVHRCTHSLLCFSWIGKSRRMTRRLLSVCHLVVWEVFLRAKRLHLSPFFLIIKSWSTCHR